MNSKSCIDEYIENHVQQIDCEFDDEGVFFYQAFCDEIADYAITNQKFGGDKFNTERMTWIKPSFGWMLYRSGYGKKSGQNRVLKIKLPHATVSYILSNCSCVEADWHGDDKNKCSHGNIQWDPARDLFNVEKKEPMKMIHKRAIQIGLSHSLSKYYNDNIISITDVTNLAHLIYDVHNTKKNNFSKMMDELKPQLPNEKIYMPHCSKNVLERIGMVAGKGSQLIAKIGFGKKLKM